MRGILFCLTLLGGIAAIIVALLMPAHLRATDPQVIARVGAEGKSLVQAAAETAGKNPAVAKLLLAGAEQLQLSGTEIVVDELRLGAVARKRSRTALGQLEAQESGRVQVAETTVLSALRRTRNREQLANGLHSVEAKQLLRNRDLTNLTLFAPVKSAAGLPLDVAILTTAFLMDEGAMPISMGLRDEVLRLAAMADHRLEELYLSMFALAKRFSSEQLIALIPNIHNSAALHALTRHIQEHPESTPVLYSAVITSKSGARVAAYLNRYPTTAERDLGFALQRGVPGLIRLLEDQQPVYRCGWYETFADSAQLRSFFRPLVGFSSRMPSLAVLSKIALLALGGFLLATSLKFRRSTAADENYVVFPQFSLVRRAAFAVVLLLLAVLLGEPYLAQGEPKPPSTRLTFSLLAAAATPPPANSRTITPMLDQHTIIAIVTFLVLQALIYAVCLAKLAEIRKQPVPSALKIKLLENEDNLFDGGLYCGLFGTAASLMLLTLGVIKPSLVSAYSSTLFGILFVALIKIGHVRPYKRRLLLDRSAETPENPFA